MNLYEYAFAFGVPIGGLIVSLKLRNYLLKGKD